MILSSARTNHDPFLHPGLVGRGQMEWRSDAPDYGAGAAKWGALATDDLTVWAGPWGVSFAANLTPDVTGLGPWTAQDFIHTMRTGKHLAVGELFCRLCLGSIRRH